MSSTSPRKTRKRRSLKTPFQLHLLQGTDLGIMALLFLVPAFLGGRLGSGQVALFAAAGGMAICWLLYQCYEESPRYRLTRFEPLLILAAILILVQCSELPANVIASISPKIREILPLWQEGESATYSLGAWSTISLSPAATRQALPFLFAYGILFVVTAQRLAHVDDIEKVFRWMALAAMGMAAIGLAQYFVGNGKYLWTYQHPMISTDGSAKGTFTNGNHFAHFLMLGSGPLFWWFMKESVTDTDVKSRRSSRKEFQYQTQRPLLSAVLLGGLGLIVFAVLMGLTRGGAAALGISLTVCLCICWKRGYVSARMLGGLMAGGGLVVVGLLLYGMDQVSTNLDDWDVDRWIIWEANLNIAKDYPILGTGLGSHFQSYRSYLNTPLFESRFTHAESGYLQVLSETGLVGISLLGLAMLFPIYWCVRGLRYAENRQEVILFAALLGSFIANYLHAIVDFIWWVPACLTMLLLQGACACRLYQITSRRHRSDLKSEPAIYLPRVIVYGVTCLVVCLTTWMVRDAVGIWQGEKEFHAFQRLAMVNSEADDAMGERTPRTLEESYEDAGQVAASLTAEQRREYAQRQLVNQVSLLIHAANMNPHDAELQYRVAEGYLIYFEILQSHSDNPMSTSQIRDAVFASEFETKQELYEWLERAFGSNAQYLYAAHAHTKTAVRLCPLQGDAYLQLAKLAFLDGAGADSEEVCLQQAEQVRPYDADVIFERGRFEWSAGKYDDALTHWKSAFHQEIRTQKRVIRLLAGAVDPPKFVEFFEPDWPALRRIVKQYRLTGNEAALEAVLPLYAERAIKEAGREQNPDAVRDWMQAVSAFQELDQPLNAERCLVAALKRYGNDIQLHETYGKLLYSMNRMEEAEQELRWCLTFKPDDPDLRRRYELAQSKRLQGESNIRLTSGQPESPPQ
ncbi:MAG: hypothetical protein CMJ46_11605 [Planctomyces sp.]|nr:hypothetical protein [Planctomyces sp.]